MSVEYLAISGGRTVRVDLQPDGTVGIAGASTLTLTANDQAVIDDWAADQRAAERAALIDAGQRDLFGGDASPAEASAT